MEHLLYVDTAIKIEKEIEEEIYKTDEKLPSERELTVRYSVSRNVVRQAITILREKGLIVVKPGKGAFVTKPKDMMLVDTLDRLVRKYKTSFEDILEVRVELETSIITNVIKKANPENIAELKRIFDLLEKKKKLVHLYGEEDLNFHLGLAKATQNTMYPILARSFYDLTEKTFFTITDFTNKSINTINKAQEHHWRIIEAIETGNQQMAVETIKEHMNLLKEEIRLLKRQGFI